MHVGLNTSQMASSKEIINLFKNVREKEQRRLSAAEPSIRKAFRTMADAYKDDKTWSKRKERKKVDYNDPALRCAYLHKHAMVHAGLVSDVLDSSCSIYSIKEVLENQEPLKVCCLGGGPGSEIVGLFLLLDGLARTDSNEQRRFFDVAVVDVSKDWEGVFDQVVGELKRVCSSLCLKSHLHHQYLEADLLEWPKVNPAVARAVGGADLITMVKFVSAAATSGTECMIEKMLNSMKPGALVLFIDNASGGFRQVFWRALETAGCLERLYQEKYYSYNEKKFQLPLYGINSQSRATVCVEVWQRLPAQIYAECLITPLSDNLPESNEQAQTQGLELFQGFDVVDKPVWVQTDSLAVSDEEEGTEQSVSFYPPDHLNDEDCFQVMETYGLSKGLYVNEPFKSKLLVVADDEVVVMMSAQSANPPDHLSSEEDNFISFQSAHLPNHLSSEEDVVISVESAHPPNHLSSEEGGQVIRTGFKEKSVISDGDETDKSTNYYPLDQSVEEGIPEKTGLKERSEISDDDEQSMHHHQNEHLNNEEEKQSSICCGCLIM